MNGDSTKADAISEAAGNQVRPSITIYEDRNFGGNSTTETTGYEYVGSYWNDKISSFKIHSGEFEFYGAIRYGVENWGPVRLGPGDYPWVADVGIINDTISSWKAFYGVGDASTSPKTPMEYITQASNRVSGSTCSGELEWQFYNNHPTNKIEVHYTLFGDIRTRYVSVPPFRNETVACSGPCKILESTKFE